MRIHIVHRSVYRYATPVRGIVQVLRMTPRDHDGQHVLNWRIEPNAEAHLQSREDSFGNITHVLSADGYREDLTIHVEGEVETSDTSGVVRTTVERIHPLFYLRETGLTAACSELRRFAHDVAGDVKEHPLEALHRLLAALPETIVFAHGPAEGTVSASDAFAAKKGAYPELAHAFIAAARHLGIPTRYVCGYVHLGEDGPEQHHGHSWAEALVPGLGWVAFDAANEICTTDAHVRVAVGLDHLGAAPIRGARYGGGSEHLSVQIRVDSAQSQAQS